MAVPQTTHKHKTEQNIKPREVPSVLCRSLAPRDLGTGRRPVLPQLRAGPARPLAAGGGRTAGVLGSSARTRVPEGHAEPRFLSLETHA